MMKRVLQFVLLLTAVALPLRAQIKTVGDGTTASVQATHLSVALMPSPASFIPGKENLVGLEFKLDPGWHIYWLNAGDSGEPPSVDWTLPQGVTAGPLLFPAPKRLPLGPLMDFGYEGDVILPMKFAVAQGAKSGMLQAKISWLVCREVCIPGSALLGLRYTVSATATGDKLQELAVRSALQKLPTPLPVTARAVVAASANEFLITVITGQRETAAEFYPFDQGVAANAAPQLVDPLEDGLRIHVRKDDSLQQTPAQLHGIVEFPTGAAYELQEPVNAVSAAAPTAADLLKQKLLQTRGAVAPVNASHVTLWSAIALAFLGGIILNLMPCVFPVLFLKGLALVQGSTEERSRTRKHGLVYTLGILVSFWVIVGVLLALRASGAKLGWGFQLQSPVFIAVLCVGLFFFALSLAGMFEFGLTLTSAGGELAQQTGYAGSFFTGVLATVVATPCTAPLMGAAIGFALAQPAWMAFVIFTAVALGLALPYLLLSFNPAWTRLLPKPGAWMEVLKQVTSLPLFATVIWLAWVFGSMRGLDQMTRLLIGLLFAAIAAWVLGRWPAKIFSTIVAVVLLLCGLAVPLAHQEATPVVWQNYSPQALADTRAAGKPVFVDFTAAWCLSCHVNEEFVLDSDEVRTRLQAGSIVLMRADWTKYDPAITAELAAVNRSGVPTYVIFPAGNKSPDVLPELLSKGVVLDALDRDLK